MICPIKGRFVNRPYNKDCMKNPLGKKGYKYYNDISNNLVWRKEKNARDNRGR